MLAPHEDWADAPPGPWRRGIAGIARARGAPDDRTQAFYAPCAEPSLLVRWSHAGEVGASVIGPLRRARRKAFASPALYVRVVLRAGHARSLLGVPLAELADRVVPLEQLWHRAGAELRERVAAPDAEGAIAAVLAALAARARPDADEPLVAAAMRTLDQPAGRVATVAADLGVSARQLRRVFHAELGMTPKHYARIARVRRALAGGWAAAGYSDQSHWIRERRDLLRR